ncbi:amine sulfotransferase-like [Bufo bufo]|uniref:amine sulfotransferase-like n=1 Tax=Bufo bufo TaxID=8384 RepID=UPI001ABE29CB|nr:amine sulfotransferase-like [Bufo bufo]XP_040284842.1 amine sulfotransferase-like [Bufo bufo]
MAHQALEDLIFKHKGIYFLKDVTTPEVVDSIEHMEVRDSDVFLVTYPKSGTIWAQQILSLIFNEGHRNETENIDNIERVPWIEYNIYNADFSIRPSPRLFSSHLPYYLLPRDLRSRIGKVIYVYRNPKDAMVSFYHFYQLFSKLSYPVDFETFADFFMSGKVIGGSWFDHVRGWYTHKEDFNILFLTYEEMKKDLRSVVLKICKFLDIRLEEKAIDIVLEKATFNNMKCDPHANYSFFPKEILDQSRGKFLRKGTIGDWKNMMTVAQNEKLNQICKEKLGDLPIKFVWDINEETAS